MSKTQPQLDKIRLDEDFELDIGYYLGNDYDEIGQAAVELPAIIEWVNMKLQALTEQKIIKKQEIKEVEARVFVKLINGGFEEAYGGKATMAAIERVICLDPKVRTVHEEYAVLFGWTQRLQSMQISLQLKLDLTRSTEATRRRLLVGEGTDEQRNNSGDEQ